LKWAIGNTIAPLEIRDDLACEQAGEHTELQASERNAVDRERVAIAAPFVAIVVAAVGRLLTASYADAATRLASPGISVQLA